MLAHGRFTRVWIDNMMMGLSFRICEALLVITRGAEAVLARKHADNSHEIGRLLRIFYTQHPRFAIGFRALIGEISRHIDKPRSRMSLAQAVGYIIHNATF